MYCLKSIHFFADGLFVQGELFKETKERLSKRTGIKGKQFEKIKFAVVPRTMYSSPHYLEDGELFPCSLWIFLTDPGLLGDILAEVATNSEDLLGLDHVNKSRSFWNRSESFFIR